MHSVRIHSERNAPRFAALLIAGYHVDFYLAGTLQLGRIWGTPLDFDLTG